MHNEKIAPSVPNMTESEQAQMLIDLLTNLELNYKEEMYMLNWFKDVNNTSHFLNGYHQGRLSVFISIMSFFVGHALSEKYKKKSS